MAKLKIERGIVMPPPNRSRVVESRFPYRDMQVGDSFFYPYKTPKGAYDAAKKAGVKISCRKEGKGQRVWRTE